MSHSLDMRPPFVFTFLLGYSLLLLFFCSWQTSPLYSVYGYDNMIFILMGRGLLQGRVPYQDLFDHKGSFLWFIEAVGLSFYDGRLGIFILQIVNMAFASFGMYKLAQKFFSGMFLFVAIFSIRISYSRKIECLHLLM